MSGREREFESVLSSPGPVPRGLAGRVQRFVSRAVKDLSEVPLLDLSATAEGVARIDFGTGQVHAEDRKARRHIDHAREELAEFFAGERGFFTVPVDLSGVAGFRRGVLEAALRIPLGQVRSYRWVAEGAGNRAAVRAAGSALRTNPVPLIVPCHRVVRSDGSLGGYAGGLPLKERLLLLERAIPEFVGIAATKRVCRAGCEEERGRSESERIVFASLEEARRAGFGRCRRCAPVDEGGLQAVK